MVGIGTTALGHNIKIHLVAVIEFEVFCIIKNTIDYVHCFLF
jgi:hypothetical protein